ncbi:MAG: DUF4279 domain-containing protein [Duganella sp.]
MTAYQYVISLRIWHPDMPQEEFSRIIGIRPKYSWTVGSPRFSPKGKPLGGFRKSSYWSAALTPETALSENNEIEPALDAQIVRFAQQADFFNRVRSEGGKAEFFVGLFSDGNIVVDIEPALMARLAHAGLGICLDYYPWKRDESSDSSSR